MRNAFGYLVAAFVFFLAAETPAHAQGRPSLLGSAPPTAITGADAKREAEPAIGLRRQRNVLPDLSVLEQMRLDLERNPGSKVEIDIPVFDDLTFVAAITRVERTNKGVTNFFGTVEGIQFSTVTLVLSRGILSGNIHALGKAYQILYVGEGRYEVKEIERSELSDHPTGQQAPRPSLPKMQSAPDTQVALADDGSMIDVLVVYTTTARAAAGGSDHAPILAQIDLAVAAANQAYQNSGVIQRIRLVHAAEVAYADSGSMGTDLTRVSNRDINAGGALISDGFMENVHTLRDTYGADLVSLWVNAGGVSEGGLGWWMTSVNSSFAPFGFSVVRRDQATSNQSFAHELGHNMGLDHDIFMSPEPDSPAFATYAHGYVNTTAQFRTIMAYSNACAAASVSCQRIDNFSSPLQTEINSGAPTGNAATGDAARALNDTRVVVSNFRQAVLGLALNAATQSVSESVGTAQVQVNRNGSSLGAVSVNYAFTNGTATNGTHFTGIPGTLNWPDGDDTPKFVPVTITDNATVNANRTFTVTLNTPTGGATIAAPTVTTVTITDDDNTLQFSAPTASVSESASVSLTVTRLGGAAGAASVNWSTSDVSAVSGDDFGVLGNAAPVAGVLNWAAGDATSKTIVIPMLNDTAIESAETFTVTLSGASGTGTSLGTQVTSTVTINDNDVGVSFALPAYTVLESGPMVTVAVNRTGSTASAIGVTWTTANGTAIAGQDFGTNGNPAQRTGLLAWAAGDATPKTITVGVGGVMPVINDATIEGLEDFTITLSAPTGGAAIGAANTTTVSITDEESTFNFDSTSVSHAENGVSTLTVTRTGATLTSANVTYTTSNGTAIAGTDFGTLGSPLAQPTGVLTFAVGVTSRTINIGVAPGTAPLIPVINDTAIELAKTFSVALSAPTGGGQLGTTTSATVTIESEDSGINMLASALSVSESVGTAQVEVRRIGSIGVTASVNYTTNSSSATAPAHYTTTTGTLTWSPGDGAAKFIAVPIVDNLAVNTNRIFTVSLNTPVGTTIGSPATTAVTIADDDNTLQFGAATYAAAEGTSATLTVTRLGGAAGAASVSWTAVNGSAVSGDDFGAPASGVLNWGAGDAAAKTIVIPMVNDALIEGNESFTVTLSAPSGAGTSIGTMASTTVTITDDDVGVSFASPTYTVIESGPIVTVSVNRTGTTTNAIGVRWTTGDGTAFLGQDFGALGNTVQRTGLLAWAAGDATAKTITVGVGGVMPVINDTATEPTENFTITLSAPTGGAALGPIPVTTVSITDDESTFAFNTAAISVTENGPNVTLNVTRTGSLATAAGVTYTAIAGTATAVTDFNAATGVISFAAGESIKTITIGRTAAAAPYVSIANDALVESDETFTIRLSAPTGGGQLGATDAIVTIVSEDSGIAMAVPTLSLSEAAGVTSIQVTRVGGTALAASVNYTFANSSAVNGTHFTGVNGTLNWAIGEGGSKLIPVTINDSPGVNAARMFTVSLNTPSAGVVIGTPSSTTVTIAEDDSTVQFQVAAATVTEGTANLVLNVTRTGGFLNPASVTWTTADGLALAGTDFGVSGNTTPVTGVLLWAAGDGAMKTVTIPILNDVLVEAAKNFTVNLSGPAGATIGTNATATVTLNDNDSGVAFAAATYSISETAGNLILTVNRIGPATSIANVTWTTVNGSAISGSDFGTNGVAAPRTGVLNWAAGDATARTISIPILNDIITDGSEEAFTVVLSAPSAGLVIGTPGTTTVTILDNDIAPESSIAFSQPKYLVMENGINAILTVNRTALPGGGFGRAASVNYATGVVGATALVTSDFTTATGTLTWPIGDSAAKTISVPITNDAIAESPETFKVLLSAPTPGSSIATPEVTVVIVDDDELFPLDGAFPAAWVTPGAATQGWIVSNDPGAYQGVFALRSEMIADNETAQTEVTGTFVAGTIQFYVRVSSEANFDFLRFYVDGVQRGQWSGTVTTGWQVFSTTILAGPHTLRWSYEKDASASLGQDAAWIDGLITPTMTP